MNLEHFPTLRVVKCSAVRLSNGPGELTHWRNSQYIGSVHVLSAEKIAAIVAENRELCRIIVASIKTARASANEHF